MASPRMHAGVAALVLSVLFGGAAAGAPDAAPSRSPPPPSRWNVDSADYEVRGFRFHDGSSLPLIKLHYRTIGKPHRDVSGKIDNAVLLLHGTGQSGAEFLLASFADPLYAPGAPLDSAKYWIVMPDSIGHGQSTRPSDGLRMRFPHYDYADMVALQHALVHDKLGIDRLRLILGTSMGCMHTYVWGTTYPDETRALMAMSCSPFPVVGLNWYWRKSLLDAITSDPDWKGGDYAQQPRRGLANAWAIASIAFSGAPNLAAHDRTQAAVDALIEARTAKALEHLDANDTLYLFRASRGYDAWSRIERIRVPVLWWDTGDDFINPPTLPYPSEAVRRMPNFTYKLVPAAADTYGHLTFEHGRFFAKDIADLLARSAR